MSIACSPGAAGIQTATWPSLWWLFTNIANTLLPRAKKVGAPCDSFSIVSGIAKQIRRTRLRCSSAGSAFGSFFIGSQLAYLFPSRDQRKRIQRVTGGLDHHSIHFATLNMYHLIGPWP